MKKALPIVITIILIGVAGWGVYMLANQLIKKEAKQEKEDTVTRQEVNTPRKEEPSTENKVQPPKKKEEEQLPQEEEKEEETEPPVTGKTAYTLSNLTASKTSEPGTYKASVKVTTSGQPAEYAQGYSLKWFIDDLVILEYSKTDVTPGEYTHNVTLSTSRQNPVIKCMLTDPYTNKTISIQENLKTLLTEQ